MANSISKLHYITQDIKGKTHAELAKQACEGGVKWVQLRMKNVTESEWKREAQKTLAVCKQYGAKLIINDHPTLAVEIGADGVHLGKNDMPLAQARAIIGTKMILGATANNLEDIIAAAKHQVDYVGLGPFRLTKTKKNLSPILGLDGFEVVVKEMKNLGVHTPIIAIGGVVIEDIANLAAVGVHGVAIASGINLAENPTQLAASFVAATNK